MGIEHQRTDKQELPGMNLLTNREATVRAMEEVEGDGRAWHDMMSRANDNTIESAMAAIGRASDAESEDDDDDDVRIVHTVYGIFGMNRWYVKSDGSVAFSERHAASPEQLEKARQSGFSIE